MSKRRFTPEQTAEIARRYNAGETSIQIGKDIVPGQIFNSTTILNALKYAGVPRRASPTANNPVITEEQRAEAVRLCRDEGLTREEVATKLGINISTVQRALNDAGVALPKGRPRSSRPRSKATDEDRKTIFAMYVAGATAREIAPKFGLSQTQISAIVRKIDAHAARPAMKRRVFRTQEEILRMSKDRLLIPKNRLRKKLQTARANAIRFNRPFDDILFDIYAVTIPANCACCGVELDYVTNDVSKSDSGRTPSFDRVDNKDGYTLKNVEVVCYYCNWLKSSASYAELKRIIAYMEWHFAKSGDHPPEQ